MGPEREGPALFAKGSATGVTMSTEKQQKRGPPHIIRLDKAFKLAEQWVNIMSKDVKDEPSFWSRVKYLIEPVERKLRAKLEAGKRKAAKSIEECSANNDVDHADSDEELESRTNGFTKKIKGTPPSSSLQVKEKLK
ncbi:conserved hypothetical protein [Ricinus communis]|uniref:Uncharacterized protein n=1 Tax=Ricinus communis TaxID=3988 RepID=B9SS05_RICCO|nr:conserved hypothetical protein [Ricinus communis]